MTGRVMAWLLEPVGATRAGRRWWVTGSMLWLAAVGPLLAWRLPWFFDEPDVEWYVKLARGEHAVMQPFAARQLAPLLVRHLAALSGLPVERCFIALGWVAYVVFAASVVALVVRERTPRWVVAMMVGMAFWGFSFNGLGLPDLLFSALTGVFLLLLWKRWDTAAALMLFPLTVSREATLLTLLCLLVAGWGRMRPSRLVLAAMAMVLGSVTVKHLSAGALSNAQDMPPALYMMGKLPWNVMRNVFGAALFTNLAPCPFPPVWQHAFHLRGIGVIGVCRVEPDSPLMTLAALTECFGVMPLLLLYAWRRRTANLRSQSVLVRFCLVYGVVSYLLAPGLGTAVDRLVRYGWPAFMVALPLLLTQQAVAGDGAAANEMAAGEGRSTGREVLAGRPWLRPGAVALLVVLHFAASWAEYAVYTAETLYVSVPATLAAWWLLRREARAANGPGERRDQLARAA